MSYLQLNKRQTDGNVLSSYHLNNEESISLIELSKPYKTDGVKYSVLETTKNPFCSNGLFGSLISACDKYLLMLRNSKIITPKEYETNLFEIKLLRGFDDKIKNYLNDLNSKINVSSLENQKGGNFLNNIVEQYEKSLEKDTSDSESKELSQDQNEDSTTLKVRKDR